MSQTLTPDGIVVLRLITCPRRMEGFGPQAREEQYDGIRPDGTCSYCGSMDPDEFMRVLEDGTAELGPTDKSYKVYVDVPSPDAGKPSVRSTAWMGVDGGPPSGDGWIEATSENIAKVKAEGVLFVTDVKPEKGRYFRVGTEGPKAHKKFYWQHLSQAQMERFVVLYNEKKLHIGYPHHFYTRPYFCVPVQQAAAG